MACGRADTPTMCDLLEHCNLCKRKIFSHFFSILNYFFSFFLFSFYLVFSHTIEQTGAFPPSTPPIPPPAFRLSQIYDSLILLLERVGIPGMSSKYALMPDPASGFFSCMLIFSTCISLYACT